MSEIKEVTVSGTVGKQVYSSTSKIELCHITLTPSAANATIKVRDGIGGVSGEVLLFGRAMSAYGSKCFKLEHKFTKGLHVTVIGTAAVAYLEIN